MRLNMRTMFAIVLLSCSILEGGCGTSSTTASTTVEELTSSSKAAVIMMASFEGVPIDRCSSIQVGWSLNGNPSAVTKKLQASESPLPVYWSVEPGEYDINSITCANGLTVLKAAGGTFVSVAKFSVKSGEVLNLGQLVIGGEDLNLKLSVLDLPANSIQSLNHDFPKLASRMSKRYMVVDTAKTNAQEVALQEGARKGLSVGNILGDAAKSLLNPYSTYHPH